MAITYGKQPVDSGLGLRDNLLSWMAAKPRLAFGAGTVAAARAWQRRARKAFNACLGPPPPGVAPRRRVLERRQMDGYHRTTFTLATAPRVKALCWLCVPDGVTRSDPRPAMIATPGHGMGAKDLLAMDARGRPRPEAEGYQKDYALQVVRLGYPVLVVEPLAFGERRDAAQMQGRTVENPCQVAATAALMLGHTLAGIRINDLRRSLDYLQTVAQVDPDRIGLMGISGGGQMTLWTTALEPRIKVAIVSGYLNTFRDSVLGMRHCDCNYVPGLARDLDMTDLAALVAPRPILFEAGTKDPIFPIRATRGAIRRVRGHYKVFGAEDRVERDIFVGDHQWSGRKVAAFLEKWL